MKYLSTKDDRFNSFIPVDKIRTPAQIMNHINGLLMYIQSYFVEVSDTYPKQLSFVEEVGRFNIIMREVDNDILSNEINPQITYHQLLQGPFADIMLHIGELSMLRKISGSDVDDVENYIFADIKSGTFR